MEHHSPFCRSNEHRLLSMGNRCCQVAGRAVAGSVQGKHPLRVHPERRLFRDDDDQFHHERCRDAISLPVALVLAPYLNVAPEVILFVSLAAAGMPFLLLVGAAPNAIAYESKQFSTAEFFLYGIPASVLLMAGIAFMVRILWPLMGMELMLTG